MPPPAMATAIVAIANAVNDVPVATASAVITNEDTAHTFGIGDFTYSDVEGDSLVSVMITNLNLAGGTLEHSGGTPVTNGMTLSSAQIASLVYTPAGNASGAALGTFDFSVNDAGTGVSTAQMGIDVTPVNDAPVVNATASDTGTEDTDVVYTHAQLLTLIGATDVDDANANLSIAITNVINGTLAMSGGSGGAGTTFTFTPTADFAGNLSFDYQVSDDDSPTPASSAVGTATVAFSAVNDTPTMIFPGTVQFTNEDTPLVFNLVNGNLIAVNDVDANSGEMLIDFIAYNGTLTLNGTTGLTFTTGDGVADTAMQFTGSIAAINAAVNGLVFTPDADFSGGTNFQMWVNDQGNTGSGGPKQTTAAALISVAGVNDAPVVNATASDTGTEDTDVVYTHAQLLTLIGATDVDDANANLSISITNVNNGTLVMSGGSGGAGTTFTFTPMADFVGNLSFDYQVSDDDSPTPASSAVGTATVAITAVNDAPVVYATASDAGTEDTDQVYTHAQLLTLIGATDVDDANANLSIAISNVNNGTLVQSGGTGGAGTTFTFTPTANYTGNLTFDYQVSDDASPTPASSAIGTATVVLAPVNDVPVASASTVTTTEDNAYTFTVADFGYTDIEGDALVSVTFGNLNLAGGTLEHSGGTPVTNGMTLTAVQIASLVYTPAANASGAPLATFDYTVNDADAGVATAQMDIDVTPVNDAAVASDDGSIVTPITTSEDTAVAIDVVANDTDLDGTIDPTTVTIVTGPANGSLSVDPVTGVVTYTPSANYNGTDGFTYQVRDNTGALSNVATVYLDITPVNDAPAGVPVVSGLVQEDQVLTADTGGISDADGLGAFSYQWLRNGAAIVGATGSTYTPGDADVGTLISVQVTYIDGYGTAEGPLVSAQTGPVLNVNDAPVGMPAMIGLVQEDRTLTADTTGISDADGTGAFSYQWMRDGIAIAGATVSTYTLGDADVGRQISVEASYADAHGTAESVTSTSSTAVVNVNDLPTGSVAIDNMTPLEGETLTASDTLADADGLSGAISYQWYRDGVAIGGATAATYTTGQADVGAVVSVIASYTDDQGTTESVSSTGALVGGVFVEPREDSTGETVVPQTEPPVVLRDSVDVTPVGNGEQSGAIPEAIATQRVAAEDDIDYRVDPYQYLDDDDLELDELRKDNVIKQVMHNIVQAGYQLTEEMLQLYDLVRIKINEVDDQPAGGLVKTAGGLALSVSAGVVSWVLRGGALAASMLSSASVLKGFDPLPVMDMRRKRDNHPEQEDDADTGVNEMFEDAGQDEQAESTMNGRESDK